MPSNWEKYKDYYNDYYTKNRERILERNREYNKTRSTARKNFVGIKIDDKIYCFKSKKSIEYIKLTKDDIKSMDNAIYV